MKRLLIAGLLFFVACSGDIRQGSAVYTYTTETDRYHVRATERFVNGVCIERVIELRAIAKTHISPHVVQYARGHDYHCNSRIDRIHFRNPLDATVNRFVLETDMLDGFYQARLKSQHN